MPISDQKRWDKYVEVNGKDPYSKCCVDVAKEAMSILDKEPGDFDCHEVICRADENIKAGGITGFMASAAAQMISTCHSRGEEFRRKWNKMNQIGREGEEANEKGGVLNPAILLVGDKEGKKAKVKVSKK
jgi:hypothetical protein